MKSHSHNDREFYLLHVRGLVQGVGFRPFIYRLAIELGLKGWVINRNDGVFIKTQEGRQKTEEFREAIISGAPKAAVIHDISITKSEPEDLTSFEIRKSDSVSNEITLVSPDIAVCDDCLEDLNKQEHRIDYPLINCTNCGPRFSIIKEIPYDRPKTTMVDFEMCPKCAREYTDILDRRFHAQPVACNNCGPMYSMKTNNGEIKNQDEILKILALGLEEGKVYTIKGLGGFHLVCNALNDNAVSRIREIKKREGKPFAVMVGSLEKAEIFAEINKHERELLKDWKRPIVLLKRKNNLLEEACNGLDRIGIMLPYMPFHHLLFKQVDTPALVMTSGNLSDEPILISNEEAIKTFGDLVDGVVVYNRDIHNRVDDSLVKVLGNKKTILRRSRAYAPSPILTNLKTEGVLAVGAELVNSFCIGKGNLALMSQYIGDLKDYENLHFFEESYLQFRRLFKFNPNLIVADLHPTYLSTQFAKKLSAKEGIPLIQVQHHHAHVASVMCEQNIQDREVIGVCMDGMGAGLNNETWGAEIFTMSLLKVKRRFYFDFIPQPGGDKASQEPWRMALSYLHICGMDDQTDLPLFKDIPDEKIQTVRHMLKNKLNCPESSSAGRLFDAVAAILGICYHNNFQAEAPMRLEAEIKSGEKKHYPYELNGMLIDFKPAIENIVNDFLNGIDIGIISAGFHNTIVNIIGDRVIRIREKSKLNTVVLSGGTFQNSYLSEHLVDLLENKGFRVYLPETVPVNDQGIALGQMAIASEMRKQGLIQSKHA